MVFFYWQTRQDLSWSEIETCVPAVIAAPGSEDAGAEDDLVKLV
jgi:hypothetical protein